MATIKQLSEADIVENGDQFPFFSEAQGDTRKVTFATLKDSVATDFVSADALAAQTGATLVGCNGGTTVQQELDARPTTSALAASSGSSLVGHIASGAGATARTVQSKLRDAIHIKDFGAVCDGVTNDYTAFANAIAYLASIGGGKLCLSGTILLNSTVNITSSGIVIEGDGHQSTWIVNGQADQPAIKFGDGINTYNRNGLSNLVFGQKSGVSAVSGNCGLYVAKCSNFVLDNVQCFQFPAALYDGVVFDTVSQSYVSKLSVQACTNRGVRVLNCLDITWHGGRSDANVTGIEIQDSAGLYWDGVTAYVNTSYGWNIITSGSNGNTYHFFSNCVGDTSGNHNWKIDQCYESIYTACWGCTQISTGVNTTAAGFSLGAGVDGLQMANCIAMSNNGHGFEFANGFRISLTNCTAGSGRQAFSANGKGGSGSGIRIGANTARINITGGIAAGNTSYGVDIASGAQKVNISNVETRFNGSGSIRNLANGSAAEAKISNSPGYNPLGFISAPAIPASGATETNLTGVDVMVYLVGGTLTGNVEINGHGVMQQTNTAYYLPAGATIKLTYSVAPAWSWNGL